MKVNLSKISSAKGENQKSLNDYLSTGLNLNPNTILECKERKIAFSLDTEKEIFYIYCT